MRQALLKHIYLHSFSSSDALSLKVPKMCQAFNLLRFFLLMIIDSVNIQHFHHIVSWGSIWLEMSNKQTCRQHRNQCSERKPLASLPSLHGKCWHCLTWTQRLLVCSWLGKKLHFLSSERLQPNDKSSVCVCLFSDFLFNLTWSIMFFLRTYFCLFEKIFAAGDESLSATCCAPRVIFVL